VDAMIEAEVGGIFMPHGERARTVAAKHNS
jgi:hypothetical protein